MREASKFSQSKLLINNKADFKHGLNSTHKAGPYYKLPICIDAFMSYIIFPAFWKKIYQINRSHPDYRLTKHLAELCLFFLSMLCAPGSSPIPSISFWQILPHYISTFGQLLSETNTWLKLHLLILIAGASTSIQDMLPYLLPPSLVSLKSIVSKVIIKIENLI